jgi:hypothetical protein
VANRGEILSRVDAYIARTDSTYTSERVRFLNDALRWLQSQILLDSATETTWTATAGLVEGQEQLALPPDFRFSSRTRLVIVDGTEKTELVRISPELLFEPFFDAETGQEIRLLSMTEEGKPRYFAIVGATLEIRPPADKTYDLELHGYSYLPDLETDSDSNILTEKAPLACVYATLRQAWLAFEDAERADYWEKKALDEIRLFVGDRIEAETGRKPPVMEAPS